MPSPLRRTLQRLLRCCLWLAVLAMAIAWRESPAADPSEQIKTISGEKLTIVCDARSVTVLQGDQQLLVYRYADVPYKPYVAEMTSPGGVNVFRDAPHDHLHHHALMFGWSVDDVDFWSETEKCGSQIHEKWAELRIDTSGGTERAILRETLLWESPEGDILFEEDRTLTIPAAEPGAPQTLIWKASFIIGEDATGALTLDGAEYVGLGARFVEPMDTDGRHFNATGGSGVEQTNGKRSTWSAYTAEPEAGKPVTVAMFDAPGNPRHPTTWFTMGDGPAFAYLSATMGVGTKALTLEPAKTLSVRFGVSIFEGAVDAGQVNAAYLRWYQLQAAAKSGLVPGLIGRYFPGDSEEPAAVRIDPSVAWDWTGGMPDDRLPNGPFSATWDGQVLIGQEGEYRFTGRGASDIRVSVAGECVFDSSQEGQRPPISLPFGYQPLHVEYTGAAPDARVELIWESNHFAPEIIGPRHLAHDASKEAPVAMPLLYDAGRAVVARYGCAGCHSVPGLAADRLVGAPLAFASQVDRTYLDRWLRDPQSVRPGSPMPALGGPAEQIDADVPAIAAFLQSLAPPKPVEALPETADREKHIAKGREQFRQLGCAACHAPEAPGEVDVTRAPSLADVGAKWPEAYVRSFLLDPLGWHPQGGMPDFKLKAADADHLAAYLSTFGDADTASTTSAPDSELVARGKQLVQDRGCAGCHEIPEVGAAAGSKLPATADFNAGCLRTDRAASALPYFTLAPADRVAVGEFLARHPEEPSTPAPQEQSRHDMYQQYQCSACHARHGSGGDQMARAVLRFSSEDPTFHADGASPPEISGVGARLQREWMLRVLAGEAPGARPWLTVSMPRFALTDQQRQRMADRLATADAIPDLKAPRPHTMPKQFAATASTLLNVTGFSCINCHYVGRQSPSGESRAPDMTMMTQRVSRDWFHRWLANPARVIPSTTMPAFDVPATKIAHEDLLVQKETMWQYLRRTPGNRIAKDLASGSVAVQVAGLRPLVIQGRVLGYVGACRGLAIGMSNRNSLAFDWERMVWRAHWKGGFVNEAGRHGAQQWWEPAGTQVWTSADNSPPILYREKATGQWIGPAKWRNRFGFLDRVTSIGRAVRLEYRLRAPGPRTGTYEPEAWVRVVEQIEPNPTGADYDGYMRTIRVSGVPEAYDVVVQQSLGASDNTAAIGQIELASLGRLAAEGLPLESHPTAIVQDSAGRRTVMRVGSQASGSWIAPPESITYPVEQPFTDDPMDPATRYEPEVTPGAGRLAVLLLNPGGDEPVELVWQTAQYAAGREIVAGGPTAHAKPAEHIALQDPAKPPHLDYPIAVENLSESRPLRVPPGYRVERLPLTDEFLVCAMTFWKGKLLVGGYDGQLRIADDTDDDGLFDRWRYFGGTLQQVNNLRVYDGQIYATSPGAVYRIADLNGDEVADSYELLSSLWDWSGHQNDWFFGLTRDAEGNLYGANSTPFIYRPGGQPPGYYLRGDVLKITPDGHTIKVGTGTRFQFGWADNRAGRMYFNINQGHYNYTNGIHLVTEGAHYGFLEPDLSKVQWPVVRAPYPWCKALNGMDFAESPVPFGPFQDQGFSADYNTNQVIRWTDYAVGDKRQGVCYPFFTGTEAGPTEIVFGPDGALYVGFMCDQGWYGGRARGGIYKITTTGEPIFSVQESRVTQDGFTVTLTAPVDPASVTLAICPKVHRWWHENKGTYASPEIAHEDVAVQEITASADGLTLHLKTDPHITPRLYRLELKGLRSAAGAELPNGLIYHTVHWVPE